MSDELDRLGEWSQLKHEILEKYARAYTTVITAQPNIGKVIYIDAYAGPGFAVDRESGEQLRGSAVRAMQVAPPFDELHFVEEDESKAKILGSATAADTRVTVHRGDGVSILRGKVLPRCEWADYSRALCLLDPYDLSIPWSLVQDIGRMKSVEIFYNFMIMDANRNALWTDPARIPDDGKRKMELVWGDRTWREACYEPVATLFGDVERKVTNETVAEAFRRRLQTVAGFPYVPTPIAMRNRTRSTVYYVFFATHNKTGAKIVTDIFNQHRR
jgi:three-Cys-motif partner protein